MKKYLYQQLTEFLLTKLPKRYHKHFYSWMEDGKLINQGSKLTYNGIEVAHIRYKAVLWFDQFPFTEIDATLLMSLIQVWLNENDLLRDTLDFHETDFELEILDEKTADLIFMIDFQEPITAMRDPQGELSIEGENYRLDEIDVYCAQQIDVEVVKGE
ncbi:phage tail protein [[Pasteurella] aerogenes]|nr:phage tail protein [[Pasteurella] aerogenes]